MALRSWKKISEKVVLQNPWWKYRCDEVELPGGTRGEYHYVHTLGSAMVIPRLENGKILMVRQYRYLATRESLEFPCGGVKDYANHERTAHIELQEETGYSASSLTLIGEFNPYNGVTDEMCRVYLAEQLSFVGATPDETEEIELLAVTPEQIDHDIRNGTLWDGMSIAGWHLARTKGVI